MIESVKFNLAGGIEAVIGGLTMFVPDDMGNLERQLIAAWEAEGNVIEPYITPPPPSPKIFKSAMFRRMTDNEYIIYEQIRAGFPPRLSALFDAVEYLSPDDEFWPSLLAAANQGYGEARAAEILAP